MDKKVYNIGVELDADFVDEVEYLKEKFGTKMAELNGFADYQMNYTGFIDNFIDKNTSDASIDGNANVHGKDIVVLENEMAKPHMKLLSLNKLFYEMKKKWGVEAARAWLEAEWDGHLYLHDAFNSTFVGYCWAGDVERVAREGLFFFDNGSHAPQHLTTFTDFVCETVSYAENRSAGAFGMPSVLVWMFYFWRKDCKEGYYIKDADYYRDQEFQRFIYKLNQPYLRSGIQSAFTNVSIFDRPYFESLFGGLEFPDGTFAIDFEEEFIAFQQAFMEEVSKIRKDCMMTFPVLTFSLLRRDGKFVDEPFARWACEHNQLWGDSNFYVSDSVDSLSSCCFSCDTEVYVMNDETGQRVRSTFAELYAKYGNFETVTTFDGATWVEAKLVRFPSKPHVMYKVTLKNGACFVATDNHINLADGKEVRTDELTLDDYLCFCDTTKKYNYNTLSFVGIQSIEEIKYGDKFVYCFEMKNQGNPYFMLANGVITHNCRMRNAVSGNDSVYFNSIGGSGLNVGSVKVNTVNLARCAYESNGDINEFLNNVYDTSYLALELLDVQRHTIQRNVEKGLLPNYSSGLVDMSKQYSTLGIASGSEAIQYFGLCETDQFGYFRYTYDGLSLYEQVLAEMHRAIDDFRSAQNIDYQVNMEQIPKKTLGIKWYNT